MAAQGASEPTTPTDNDLKQWSARFKPGLYAFKRFHVDAKGQPIASTLVTGQVCLKPGDGLADGVARHALDPVYTLALAGCKAAQEKMTDRLYAAAGNCPDEKKSKAVVLIAEVELLADDASFKLVHTKRGTQNDEPKTLMARGQDWSYLGACESPPPVVGAFDKLVVPNQALAAARNALAAAPAWGPRFRTIRYGYNWTDAGTSGTVTGDVQARDGLVYSKEDSGPVGVYESLSFINFFMLKFLSTANGAQQHQIAKTAELHLPVKVASGATIRFRGDIEAQGNVIKSALDCVLGEAFDARVVHPSLSGRAFNFSCTAVANGSKLNDQTFLQDLGLVLEVSRAELTAPNSPRTVKFTRFEIEK